MKINYIPLKARPKRPSRAPYLLAAMVYILAMLFLGAKIGKVLQFKQEAKGKRDFLATITSNLSKNAPALAKLENMTAEGNRLVKTGSTLQDISRSNIYWAGVLYELARAVPEELWFEELELSSSSVTTSLTGFGVGERTESKALELVTNLQKCPLFSQTFRGIGLVSCKIVEEGKKKRCFEIAMQIIRQ